MNALQNLLGLRVRHYYSKPCPPEFDHVFVIKAAFVEGADVWVVLAREDAGTFELVQAKVYNLLFVNER